MLVEYLFSTSEGDLPAEHAELALPFKLTPTQNHPHLTLKDYFDAIKAFIFKDRGKPLEDVLRDKVDLPTCSEDIRKIEIRSEKHGVLYHLSSVKIFSQGSPVTFSVSTSITEKGRKWLNHEFDLLNLLHRHFKFSYLPEPYFSGEVSCHSKASKETLTMMLSEWFEDYHEWHFSRGPGVGNHNLCIWDLQHGNRFASREQSFSILKQVSRILTLYYDPETYLQIYPWHHAAGDFIVRVAKNEVDVKLTTARKYESFMEVFSTETVNPVTAIIYFFMNLTIRIRLDKLDGVGEIYWAEDFSVIAATAGFFEAVNSMVGAGRLPVDHAENLLSLLKSFDLEELKNLFDSLLVLYAKDDPEDFQTIRKNLKNHVGLFHRTLQEFSL